MTMKTSCSVLIAACLLMLGCDTKTKNVDSCGDDFLDPGEECDGNQLTVNTCTDLGYYDQLAPLTCKADCTFDLTVCSGGRCGDGILQFDKGEKCDGENLDDMTCATLGLGGGTLACKDNCRFDVSRCELTAECGDDVAASPYEPCDGSDLDDQTCESLGFFKGTLACMEDCAAFDTAGCTNCGNGAVDGGEACDGANLNQATCESEGYSGGTLACTTLCTIDFSACEAPVTCGNGQLDDQEQCDGTNLNGATCASQGYFGGQLGCRPNCAFDVSECTNCGNGQLDASEVCDGANLNSQTCGTQGWYGGTLACASDCLSFNDSSCIAAGRCGDGTIQAAQGEECDGNALGGGTCVGEGFYEGTLTCGSDCRYVTTGCLGFCGDMTIQSGHGEVCEGSDLNGQTCATQGFVSGTLACNAGCTGFVTTGCSMCGNNAVNAGETCDGSALNGQTCATQGFVSGTLACNVGCTGFVTTGCSMCGNNTVNAPEVCDGSALNGQTCVSQGFVSGTLACNAGCTGFVTTGCSMCGNNAVNAGEACDGSALNGETCVSQGFVTGTLACDGFCEFDTTGCSMCGNNTVNAPEVCDGSSLNGQTCVTQGFASGTLACDGFCEFDTTGCSMDYTSANIGTLIYVPAGTFQRDETATNLSVVSAFRMSQYEITRAQWTAVTGWADPSNAGLSSGTDDPVQQVSWYNAIAFCNKLSLLEGLTPVYAVSGVDFSTLTYAEIPTTTNADWNAATANWAANGYRLPTEMEWMWAAMGADTANPGAVNTTGYSKSFAGSTGSNVIGDYAVFGYNSGQAGATTTQRSNPVGSKLANELGFHDLSGNVFEWVWDWNAAAYPTGTLTDHRGPASGSLRVMHGGTWSNSASSCTVANRTSIYPYGRNSYTGYRVVRP